MTTRGQRRRACVGRRRIVVDHRGCVRANLCRMCTPDRKCRGRDPPSDITHQRRAEDDHRKGNGKSKNRDKRESRDDPQRGMLQRPRSDAPRRLQHDRNDGGLDAVEHAAYRRHVAIRHVQPGQADEQHERRQDEQAARNDPTPSPVQQPADVRRQLLRLRAGRTMQKLSACKKRFSAIQRFSSTSSRCISAICPAGPPKLMQPSRNQYRNASPRVGARGVPLVGVPSRPWRPVALIGRCERASLPARERVVYCTHSSIRSNKHVLDRRHLSRSRRAR